MDSDSPDESLPEQYRRFVTQLEDKVTSYTGTRAQENALLEAGRQVEDVVAKYEREAELDPNQRPQSEQALARTAGLTFTDNYYERFGQAAAREGFVSALEKLPANDPAQFLAALERMGIAVNRASKTLIDTEPETIETGSGAGMEFRFQPRLMWVIGLLLENDIATDEFYVDPGLPE
jgi:hypothetical protein